MLVTFITHVLIIDYLLNFWNSIVWSYPSASCFNSKSV